MLDYPSNEWDVIEELIKEHFELVEKYNNIKNQLQHVYTLYGECIYEKNMVVKELHKVKMANRKDV